MSKLEEILKEIDKASDNGIVDIINGEPVIPKKRAKDIIRKHMDGMEYPYMTKKDIEAATPASKEFLDECREVAKKYGKNDGWIPIEKELPKKGENVLLCSDDGRMMIGVFQNDYYTAFGVAVAENYNQTMHNCVAWQSLPEPYRPERRDDHDRE